MTTRRDALIRRTLMASHAVALLGMAGLSVWGCASSSDAGPVGTNAGSAGVLSAAGSGGTGGMGGMGNTAGNAQGGGLSGVSGATSGAGGNGAAGENTAGNGTAGTDAAGSGGTLGTAGSGGMSAGSGGGPNVNCPFPGSVDAIVTLNYDDGLDVHLQDVAPALDARGLKASFFLANYQGEDHNWALPNLTAPLNERHNAWRALAMNGHELSGHTVFHPCDAGHLASYTTAQMSAELDENIARLERLGATAPFTFGYPCLAEQGIGNPTMDFGPLVEARFIASRKSPDMVADPTTVDFYVVPNLEPVGKTGAQLRAYVDEAIANHGWAMYGFHGVGTEQASCPQGNDYAPESCMINYLTSSTEAHEELLDYLVEKQDQVWTATFKDVVQCLQTLRQ